MKNNKQVYEKHLQKQQVGIVEKETWVNPNC
jgi:hypothetical protein